MKLAQPLSLPLMQAMDDIDSSDDEDKDHRPVPGLESRDPVAEGNAVASDGLADAPLSSLYEVTRLRSLNDNGKHQSLGVAVQPDFVARNIVALAEAEQLAMYYLGRLDPFIYNHLQQYPDFGEIRKTSTLLALTVCTVAALHDPLGSEVYSKLSRELRDLASSLMFRERIGPEDIKALCMGAYWLPRHDLDTIRPRPPPGHLDAIPHFTHESTQHRQVWIRTLADMAAHLLVERADLNLTRRAFGRHRQRLRQMGSTPRLPVFR